MNKPSLVPCVLLLLLVAALALGQESGFSGAWAGPLVREAGTVGLEITLARDGANWKATMSKVGNLKCHRPAA